MTARDRLRQNAQQIVTTCACSQVRKAARAITQLYDDCLQPSGLRITQFYLLLNIYIADAPTVTGLAQALQFDQTTMTRNLKLLERQGMIEMTAGVDRRTRIVSLTPKGNEAIAQAIPLWQQAQAQVTAEFGADAWQLLQTIVQRTPSLN
ncbi:MAG: winged helix-turn-helix transcriptional regulator [Microcoleus sp. SIO2G3]|nr:winged helix-turn-helix transcriptional regulator [Microcoleus sp. SIO2G3]